MCWRKKKEFNLKFPYVEELEEKITQSRDKFLQQRVERKKKIVKKDGVNLF